MLNLPLTTSQNANLPPFIANAISDPKVAAELGGVVGFLGAFMIMLVIIGIVVWFFYSLCIYMMAKKIGTGHRWAAWIPIINKFYPVIMAGRPWYWIVILIATPIISFYTAVLYKGEEFMQVVTAILIIITFILIIVIWVDILRKLKKPGWWVILLLIPIINLIIFAVMAFSGMKQLPQPHPHKKHPKKHPKKEEVKEPAKEPREIKAEVVIKSDTAAPAPAAPVQEKPKDNPPAPPVNPA